MALGLRAIYVARSLLGRLNRRGKLSRGLIFMPALSKDVSGISLSGTAIRLVVWLFFLRGMPQQRPCDSEVKMALFLIPIVPTLTLSRN